MLWELLRLSAYIVRENRFPEAIAGGEEDGIWDE